MNLDEMLRPESRRISTLAAFVFLFTVTFALRFGWLMADRVIAWLP